MDAGKRADALDINWRRRVLGPDSICVAVVDPWELRLGVMMAMDAERELGGTTEGTAPVRTDGVSGVMEAPETCICVGGAAGLELVGAGLELVGAAVCAGFVDDVFACISPRLMRSLINRWYPSSSKLSNCSLGIQLCYFPRPRPV